METVSEFGTIDSSREREFSAVRQGYTYFADGDVLVAKITPCFENGKGAVAQGLQNGIGFGTTELFVLRPRPELDERFLYYVTMSAPFRQGGEGEMYGAGGQKRVPDSFVRDFRMWVPPLPRQRAIADFLDRETARIDALLARQLRAVALLEQEKAAITASRLAVMRENARVYNTRLKYTVSRIIDTEHKTAPFFEDGEFLVVRTSNVRRGQLVLADARYTDADGYVEWTQRGRPQAGDVIFTREAPAGEACVVPVHPPLCLGQRTVLLKLDNANVNSEFLVLSLYSGQSRHYISLLSQGSTVSHFNMADIGNIPITMAPLPVQEVVLGDLRPRFEKVDLAVAALDRAMDRLREYRSALITAAVTGHMDVATKPEVTNVGNCRSSCIMTDVSQHGVETRGRSRAGS